MTLVEIVTKKFEIHGNRGHIADTCLDYLEALDEQARPMKGHVCRVALVSEAVAARLGKDARAAFYGGLLHDFGKILMPPDLFNGQDINPEQYRAVQAHAERGFRLLRESHLFSALIAGLHHQVGRGRAYGIACKDIPEELDIETVEAVTELAQIISAADFADAALHRSTHYLGEETGTLRAMMLDRYDDDAELVDAVLEEVGRFSAYPVDEREDGAP